MGSEGLRRLLYLFYIPFGVRLADNLTSVSREVEIGCTFLPKCTKRASQNLEIPKPSNVIIMKKGFWAGTVLDARSFDWMKSMLSEKRSGRGCDGGKVGSALAF